MFLYSYDVYFILWNKWKKWVAERNKRFNLWSLWSFHSLVLKIFSCKGPTIYDAHKEKGWRGFKICHVLTDSIVFKQQIYCLFLQKGGCWGMVCGHHNCMVPNIKTYFDKKVTFLVFMAVLHWNKPSRFLIYYIQNGK